VNTLLLGLHAEGTGTTRQVHYVRERHADMATCDGAVVDLMSSRRSGLPTLRRLHFVLSIRQSPRAPGSGGSAGSARPGRVCGRLPAVSL